MIYEIQKDFAAFMETKKRGQSLQNNLRASSFGLACDRFHYYSLTEYRKPVDATLQAIFDDGALHEKDVERKLHDMGYETDSLQKEFRMEKPLITAHIDGRLRKAGAEWAPYDAKSINPWDFDGLNSAEDFILSQKPHQRNYAAQILLYMLVTSCEHGCLILKNKQTGWIKDIWFDFNTHVGILDEAIKRAERVYESKETKIAPSRTDDRSLCARCDWRDICLPDLLASGGVGFIDSDDLRGKLAKRESLKPAADEFNDLDEEVKKTIKETGVGEKAAGEFLLTVKERTTTRKKPITWTDETTSYLTVNITKIGPDND